MLLQNNNINNNNLDIDANIIVSHDDIFLIANKGINNLYSLNYSIQFHKSRSKTAFQYQSINKYHINKIQ